MLSKTLKLSFLSFMVRLNLEHIGTYSKNEKKINIQEVRKKKEHHLDFWGRAYAKESTLASTLNKPFFSYIFN
jgi:hypothetical protein